MNSAIKWVKWHNKRGHFYFRLLRWHGPIKPHTLRQWHISILYRPVRRARIWHSLTGELSQFQNVSMPSKWQMVFSIQNIVVTNREAEPSHPYQKHVHQPKRRQHTLGDQASSSEALFDFKALKSRTTYQKNPPHRECLPWAGPLV